MATIRNTIFKILLVLCVSTCLAVLALRWVDPPISAFILASPGAYAEHKPVWSDWDETSPWLPAAIIAAEDQKFPFHWGFDTAAIQQAVIERLEGNRNRLRGASTITQQLAKNLFLWPERSWLRKGVEVYFTILLEVFLSKQRILELYINLVEFGPYVFSASSASNLYFAKSANKITLEEASMLAAVLPNPRQTNLHQPSKQLRQKAARIRQQVRALGGVSYLKNL